MAANSWKTYLTPKVKRLLVIGLILLVSFTIKNWLNTSKATTPTSKGTPSSVSINVPQVQSLLDKLTVADSQKVTYKRSDFGTAWKDVDNNNCDTRNDILKRDLTNLQFKGSSDCTVQTGTLLDPYTGKTINFVLGNGALVDIDHVIALGNVAISGGMGLTAEKRESIANDPENLIAVDASANRAKGDKDAAAWLPPNASYQCTYVAKQVQVKSKYSLTVTPAEKAAMKKVLVTC
jgi:hypothetical protein